MAARISIMILRLAVLVEIILGILFWTGNYIFPHVVDVHQLIGVIAVICLWVIAIVLMTTKPGNVGLLIGAIVYGLIVIGFGAMQSRILVGDAHVIIRIVHLLLGLGVIGFAEMLNARYKRI